MAKPPLGLGPIDEEAEFFDSLGVVRPRTGPAGVRSMGGVGAPLLTSSMRGPGSPGVNVEPPGRPPNEGPPPPAGPPNEVVGDKQPIAPPQPPGGPNTQLPVTVPLVQGPRPSAPTPGVAVAPAPGPTPAPPAPAPAPAPAAPPPAAAPPAATPTPTPAPAPAATPTAAPQPAPAPAPTAVQPQEQTQGPTVTSSPVVRFDKMPGKLELETMLPGAQAMTPYGPMVPDGKGGHTLTFTPEGKQAWAAETVRIRNSYGPNPFSGDPSAPKPNVTPGKPAFDFFSGRWVN